MNGMNGHGGHLTSHLYHQSQASGSVSILFSAVVHIKPYVDELNSDVDLSTVLPVPAYLVGVKAGCVHLCRVAGNTV